MEKSYSTEVITNTNIIQKFSIKIKDMSNSFVSQQKKSDVSLYHFFTGAIAGAISRTATCPLERIKMYQFN